ncbi:MAG TPA: hypothetical protein PLM56_04215 [Cyclobacteriaceae bacterium]|jgi:hypothetical protein|nr:hypothetical protein [Cytophagales bacterium]HNT50063.1 hypothetical protein [Cyclobacteriaceae bacterium]HRF32680.1 hypothetical protein [Cyclobacteriaceae bacterium]
MKKILLTCLSAMLVAGSGLFVSCDEETFALPEIELSTTAVTASPGEDVSVVVTINADAGFKNLTVTKFWDGVKESEEVLTTVPSSAYVYHVTDEDADHITTINFTVTDSKNKTASIELVITVELTPLQVLLKYNWRLDQEIWIKTGTNEITDAYTDDVYRFNANGTYDKSIGAKVDDFSDIWFNYCYYDLNQNTLRLLMSKTGAFGEEVTDTLNITVIDSDKIYANIRYHGLDVFDPKYSAMENFQKRFVAVAKTANFDPYQAGADDNGGPAGMCAEVEFDND